ncbi:MAG: TonB-dependent receptor [Muribaculaceae bacterium]|nr:TonB-dependent receptor [Muribaculaceae bacterium]
MKNVCFTLCRKALVALALLLTFTLPALAQKITVHGNVDDPTGEPLIGATVMEKGTSNGTATDFDGNFTINVAPNATLVFSYIGYDSQEVPVNGRTEIKVTLQDNATMLAETVVIGYGSVKKSDATGSVAVVKPSEIEAGLATSAQDLLVGASPGVVVTLDGGNPSGGANIQIRGGASLNASNDPLIVVDGVPMDTKGVKGSSNPLSLISPENVESMTILKDASATAIYGSRASNGVIIITTKQGKSGRPQVNFTANMYVNTPRKYLNMMDGPTFRNFILNEYGAESLQASALGDYNTNWSKEALHTTVSSDYSLSVGGKVGFLPYRVAVSYTNNNGILRGTSMDRVTGSINLTPKFWNDLLSINVNVKGSYVKNDYADNNLGSCVSMNPTLPVKDYENGAAYLGYWTSYGGGGVLVDKDTPYGTVNGTTAPLNPIAGQLEATSDGTSYQSVGNLQIDLKMPFLTDLRANLNLGYDIQKGNWFGYSYPNTPKAWQNGYGVKLNPESDDVTVIKDGGVSATKQYQLRRNLLLDFYLNYNHEFESIGSVLDVTAGYSWQNFYNKGHDYSYVYNVGNPEFYPSQYAGQDHSQYLGQQAYPTNYYSTPHQLVSFFGRVNYSIFEKYLITATVRYDGTSRFSKANRWGLFPSVALAWKLLDENFMQFARGAMNELKIRAGYGVTGQQDVMDEFFPYLPVYNVSTDVAGRYPMGDEYYFPVTPGAYNADIKWEETRTWNVGIDFGFANNRINGAIDFYKRKTVDLLTKANYPAGSNLTNVGFINIGDLENTGIELTLNTRPIVTNDFTWNSNLNVAWNKNKITRLADGVDAMTGDISAGTGGKIQKHSVGHSANSFYVYEQVYAQDGTPLDGVFVDRNGDGEITESDKYLYHSKDPKVTLTWANTFNYKNWDFGITLRSNIGNWVYNNTMASTVFKSANTGLPLSNLRNDTHLFAQSSLPQIMSDYFVQNASFLRCDNITAGYTWRNLLGDKLRIRLYGAVQNPFVITKYKGLDPEIFNGIDNGVYPNPITFSLGLVATF